MKKSTEVGDKTNCSDCEVVKKLEKKIKKLESELEEYENRAYIDGMNIVY